MTVVKRVSLQEMVKETGLDTLGYAKPKDNVIFLRKGLSKDKEKEVLAHEFDHIKKDEEGPFWGAIISAAGSLLGGQQKAKAEERAGERAAKVADPFGEYRSPFQEMLLNLYGFSSQPGAPGEEVNYGKTILTSGLGGGTEGAKWFNDPLGILGISGGIGPGPSGPRTFTRIGEPGGGGMMDYFKNLPGYKFSLGEMMRATTRAGAATGGLRSGKLMAELQQRAGGLAEQTYSAEIGRLMELAGASKGSPAAAAAAIQSGGSAAAESRAAGLSGATQALGYGFGNKGFMAGEQNLGGGTTTWGDKYVQKDYGPVINRDEFSGWGEE